MEIQEWLQNPVYTTGVELYKNTKGHNKLLLRQFALRENAQRKEKLIYELKKLLPTKLTALPTPLSAPVVKLPAKQQVILQTAEKESKRVAPLFHELPSELRPVLLEANNLFKENCLLKAELNEVAIEDEERALSIQIKIDRNFKANAMCWDKIEYWRKHKQLPKVTAVQSISAYSMDKLIKQQQLLNSSVSRMEKRLATNKRLVAVEEDPAKKNKLLRQITKQEAEVIKKREELLTIKTTIDVKLTSI